MHKLLVFVLALIPLVGAFAGDLRARDSDRMMVEGTITGVKRSGDAIVLTDRLYYLGPQTQVERYDGGTGSTADLAEGQQVGCNFLIDERQRLVLTTVRILRPAAASGGQASGQGAKLGR